MVEKRCSCFNFSATSLPIPGLSFLSGELIGLNCWVEKTSGCFNFSAISLPMLDLILGFGELNGDSCWVEKMSGSFNLSALSEPANACPADFIFLFGESNLGVW